MDQEGAEYDASGLGRFYSVPSAVGILFGTGNTGRALDASGVLKRGRGVEMSAEIVH